MQNVIEPDRLACAVFNGEKAVEKAVEHLVEAGFASESIHVLLGHAVGEEPSEIAVRIRTGVRQVLPWAALLGALGGAVVAFFDGISDTPLPNQLVTGVAMGGFLGAMAGIVLGLGHWQHFVDFPDLELDGTPLWLVVDLASEGRETTARLALASAGAEEVRICSSDDLTDLTASGKPRAPLPD